MHFQVLTIFPELFEPFLKVGLLAKASSEGKVTIETQQLRDFAVNAYGQVDDSPYGGGSGMVLRPEPAVQAIETAKQKDPGAKVVLLSPRGKTLTQEKARSLATSGQGMIVLCCRYEGVDQRVVDHWVDEEISIGDYIMMGAEAAAIVLLEAVVRLRPEVLGNPESLARESFDGGLLEHSHYTKPAEFRGHGVPPVLLSGHHAEIERYRREESIRETRDRRPDLLWQRELPQAEVSVALIHHPVLNKEGGIITSSVTNIDLHDIARSSRTFGVKYFYAAHPTKMLRRLSEIILEHWDVGHGAHFNPNRKDALQTVKIVPDIDEIVLDIESRTGKLPIIITTSARPSDSPKAISFVGLRQRFYRDEGPFLLLLGTGWGLAPEIHERADLLLEPIDGFSGYNHLSVRAAAAIMFDRLLGKRPFGL